MPLTSPIGQLDILSVVLAPLTARLSVCTLPTSPAVSGMSRTSSAGAVGRCRLPTRPESGTNDANGANGTRIGTATHTYIQRLTVINSGMRNAPTLRSDERCKDDATRWTMRTRTDGPSPPRNCGGDPAGLPSHASLTTAAPRAVTIGARPVTQSGAEPCIDLQVFD